MKGLDAYKAAQSATVLVDGRQAEADALLRIAREIETTKDGDPKPLMTALIRNIKIWNYFARDCVLPANQLPTDLKAQIVSLAVWVVGRSEEAISERTGVEALVEINRTIARGLMSRSAGQGADGAGTASRT